MHTPVTVQSTEGISVLTIDHPPVNALTLPVIGALSKALRSVIEQDDVGAIVIAARGKTFPAGLDLRDFEDGAAISGLGEVCQQIEESPIPVIAALHGTVLGGGLELAIAAHHRFADRRAVFAMPDISLGLCPGAGGTQRLPRLIGAARAADMLLGGQRIGAADALKIGLIDAVAEGPLPIFTLREVKARLDAGTLERRPTSAMTSALEPKKDSLKAIEAARARIQKGPLDVGEKIVDCIQGTLLLPFEAGLIFERSAFDDLVASPESRALRHVFIAERRTRTPPLDDPVEPKPISTVGVMGLGVMGTGIAVSCLDAGLPVTVVETTLDRLETGVENIIDIYDRQVKRGRLDEAERERRMSRLTGKIEPEVLSGVDVVIETVPDDAGEKRRAFTVLDAVMKRGAILATNTSEVDIDGLATLTGRSEDVVGLHFFPPAHMIRLVEVVVAMDTSDETIATAFAFARRIGKTPIVTGVGDGFVAERVHGAYLQAAELLLEDGASVEKVDAAMRTYGFPMGPFQMSDLIGLDSGEARRVRYAEAGARVGRVTARLLEAGRFGRKTGNGFYSYDETGQIVAEDEERDRLIADIRAARGGDDTFFTEDEIQRRCAAAMSNEGARIMEEGLAQRPSDIDVAMILAYGFPRWRGGPMMAADLTGLLRTKRDLELYAEEDAVFWTPAELISDLVKNGQTFDALNDV